MLFNATSLPDVFYVFIAQDNPITMNNLIATKSLFSASYPSWEDPSFVREYLAGTVSYLPFVPAPRTAGFMSMFAAAAIAGYCVEYDAEVHRMKCFPLMPSRLSAIYAFGDYETCRQASAEHHWDLRTVKRFRLVENELNRVARVNMGIVSLANRVYRSVGSRSPDLIQNLWGSYWGRPRQGRDRGPRSQHRTGQGRVGTADTRVGRAVGIPGRRKADPSRLGPLTLPASATPVVTRSARAAPAVTDPLAPGDGRE